MELTMEMLGKAAGGGPDMRIGTGDELELSRELLDNKSSQTETTGGGNCSQDNSNNTGAQQNVQGDYNSNDGGLNVTGMIGWQV